MVGQPRFFHVEVHPLEEKKALREAGALLLADQAASSLCSKYFTSWPAKTRKSLEQLPLANACRLFPASVDWA